MRSKILKEGLGVEEDGNVIYLRKVWALGTKGYLSLSYIFQGMGHLDLYYGHAESVICPQRQREFDSEFTPSVLTLD